MSIFIKASDQISIQQPLSTEWMENPIVPTEKYRRALDPNFKEWLNPGESRRLGILLKRAQTIALSLEKQTGIAEVDAILVGTGLGCMDNTEKLLNCLVADGEKMFSPTLFMQSTHNTIASHLAIHSKSHGYNITYAHKDLSFDLSLYDAWMQFKLGKIRTALVGGFDELTPSYFAMLEKIGYMGGEMSGTGTEAASATLLSIESSGALCELGSMRVVYKPSEEVLRQNLDIVLSESGLCLDDISAVIIGTNGNVSNDKFYNFELNKPKVEYKKLFGTSYSASSYALYVGANCINKGYIPSSICSEKVEPKNLLILNHSEGKEYSLIILKSLC